MAAGASSTSLATSSHSSSSSSSSSQPQRFADESKAPKMVHPGMPRTREPVSVAPAQSLESYLEDLRDRIEAARGTMTAERAAKMAVDVIQSELPGRFCAQGIRTIIEKLCETDPGNALFAAIVSALSADRYSVHEGWMLHVFKGVGLAVADSNERLAARTSLVFEAFAAPLEGEGRSPRVRLQFMAHGFAAGMQSLLRAKENREWFMSQCTGIQDPGPVVRGGFCAMFQLNFTVAELKEWKIAIETHLADPTKRRLLKDLRAIVSGKGEKFRSDSKSKQA